MFRIEQQINDAILNSRNWKSRNTSVNFDSESNLSTVFVFGEKIAVIGDNFVQIFCEHHRSKIIKSRLNSICKKHCLNGEGIYEKKGKWYIRAFAGKFGNTPFFIDYDFESGFIFS